MAVYSDKPTNFVSKALCITQSAFLCYRNAINGKKIRHDICNIITSELKWIYKSDANGKKIRWSAVWKSIEIYILNDLSLENTMVLLRLLPEFEEVENHIY